MKILITYASCGRGHQTAAEAIYGTLKKHFPQAQAQLCDILAYTPKVFRGLYSGGYYLLASRFGFIWKLMFGISGVSIIGIAIRSLCRAFCRDFSRELQNTSYDVVVSTHFFPSDVVSSMKKREDIKLSLVTVITDFGVHPLWLSPECDSYICACDITRDILISLGVKQERIMPLGLPVKEMAPFTQKPHPFTVMLATGSFGFPLLETIAENLKGLADLIVVCGSNEQLYRRLKQKEHAGLRVYGFTGQMADLMLQSDLLVTKPGGLSISEALTFGLPLVLIPGIPGQETENARIMKQAGCAFIEDKPADIRQVVEKLKSSPQLLEDMRVCARKLGKPSSTMEICEYVCKGGFRPAA